MLNDLRGQTLFALPYEIDATVAGLKMLGDRIASLGAEAPVRITTDDHNYCKAMAAADRGLTFEPIYPPTLRDTDTLAWRPFRDPEILLNIYMVWRKGRQSPEIRSLFSIAKQYFSETGE